jgi:hypothetical protein
MSRRPRPSSAPRVDRDVRTRRCVRRRALHGDRRRPQLTAGTAPHRLDADRKHWDQQMHLTVPSRRLRSI